MALTKFGILDLELSSSQYASIAHAAQTGLSLTGAFTFMCWIRPETYPSVNGVRHTLVSKYDVTGGGYEINIVQTGGTDFVEVRIRQNGSTEDVETFAVSSTGILQEGTDYCRHIAVVVNFSPSLSVNFYADGIDRLGAQTGSSTSIGTNTSAFTIGARSGGSNFWDGTISDAKLFNEALNRDNIIAHMRHFRVTSNMVGFWKLDNDYLDSTTNGNHLTATGSPVFTSTGLPFNTYGRTSRFFVGPGDGHIVNGDTTFAGQRGAADGDSVSTTGGTFKIEVSKGFSTSAGQILRGFMPVDTSSFDGDVQVVGAALGFVPTATANGNLCLVQTTQASFTTLVVGDFDQCGSLNSPTEGATRHGVLTTDLNVVNWMNLNSSGVTWIEKGGFTALGFRMDRDVDNNPFLTSPAQENSVTINASEASGTNNDLFLDVIDDDSYFGGSTDEGGAGGGAGDFGGVDLGGGGGAAPGTYDPPSGGGGSGGDSSPGASLFFSTFLDS